MNNTKKNLIALTSALLIVASMVPASIVSANDVNEHAAGGQCNSVHLEKLEQKLLKAEQKHNSQLERQGKSIAHKNEKSDKKRANGSMKLGKKWADNTAAKALLAQYKAAVESALNTYPASNNAALAIFNTAITNLETARKAAMNAALQALKTSCASTTADHTAAWKTFNGAVKAANKAFHDGHKAALATLRSSSKDSREAFRAAIATAKKAFQDGMKALKASQ